MDDRSGPARTTTGSARERRNVHSHQAILKATWDLMRENGYPALNIEAVAARAGVGKATIYRWWPSKGTLAVEALRTHLTLSEIPDSGDARADVYVAVRFVTDTLLHHAAGRIIPALANDLLNDPSAADTYREFVRARRESALAALRRAAEKGVLPADADLEMLVDIYAGTVYYRVIVSGLPVDQHVADTLAELVLDGRCPRVPAPRTRRSRAARTAGGAATKKAATKKAATKKATPRKTAAKRTAAASAVTKKAAVKKAAPSRNGTGRTGTA